MIQQSYRAYVLKTNTSVESEKCNGQDPKRDLVHDTKIKSIPTGRKLEIARKKNRRNHNQKPNQKPP
jgi:hypothetical protein